MKTITKNAPWNFHDWVTQRSTALPTWTIRFTKPRTLDFCRGWFNSNSTIRSILLYTLQTRKAKENYTLLFLCPAMKWNLLFTFFHILLASLDTELAPPLKLLPSRNTLEWESDASKLIWRSWGLTSFLLLWLDSMNLWIVYKLGNNFISSNGKGHLSKYFMENISKR